MNAINEDNCPQFKVGQKVKVKLTPIEVKNKSDYPGTGYGYGKEKPFLTIARVSRYNDTPGRIVYFFKEMDNGIRGGALELYNENNYEAY